ncbi:MAG: F0F1 ATP synthase subunit gamma [Actinomycetota bacterium]
MEQLARLRARLTTLTELGDIIVAMRALAAAALQESRKALPAVSRYALLIESGISDVAAMLDATAEPAPEDDSGETETICIIGSEHGFVGDLNAELLAASEIPRTSRLIVVGRRLQVAAAERELSVAAPLPMTTHVAGVPLLARKIAERIGAASHVRLITAQRGTSKAGVGARSRQVLPVKLPAPGTRSSPPPLSQLKPRELLAELAGEYLLAEINRALIESLAGENEIRLGVLTAANKNISDKRDELRRKERSLRQETITTELLDVVVGAEAVIEAEGH